MCKRVGPKRGHERENNVFGSNSVPKWLDQISEHKSIRTLSTCSPISGQVYTNTDYMTHAHFPFLILRNFSSLSSVWYARWPCCGRLFAGFVVIRSWRRWFHGEPSTAASSWCWHHTISCRLLKATTSGTNLASIQTLNTERQALDANSNSDKCLRASTNWLT